MTTIAAKKLKTSEISSSAGNLRLDRDKSSEEFELLKSVWPQRRLRKVKIKQEGLILFTTQLSVMLDSGVILSDALDAISAQTEPGALKMIIFDISETVKSGETFSKALVAYPKVFNDMFISMVKASEASGKMPDMLRVLSGYLEFETETRKNIKAALTYPFIMALMAVAATGTLMFFVLPRFMNIYESRGAALPKITQVLVSFSKCIGNPKIMVPSIIAVVLAAIGFHFWKKTLSGQKAVDYLKINTPVVGTMFIDTVITRSMRIMATMVNTGVSLLDSLEVVKDCCKNYYFQRLWSQANDKIRDGYQFSESIRLAQDSHLIDAGIIQMLQAGEKSGKLGSVTDKISSFYEKKLQGSIKNVMTMIEPLMITVLGIIIGTIAIALLLPVFRISTVVSK